MARATIFQTTQVGAETTPGVAVVPTKRLSSVGFEIDPNPEINKFRPTGMKFPTVTTLAREWTELSIEGALTYTEVVYLLSGIMKKTTPTGSTAKTWAFAINSTGADTVQTYTLRQGDGTGAIEVNHVLITELGLEFSRDGIEVSGSAIGTAVTPNASMAGGVSGLPLIPVQGQDVAVYLADTYAGLDEAQADKKVISVSLNLGNRFAPAWFLNQKVSYDDHIEDEPSSEVELLHEADSVGMGLFTTMRNGDIKFMRIECVGPQIGEGPDTYLIEIDMALKVMDMGAMEDSDGIYAVGFNFELFHSDDLGGAINATVVNELASL